MITEKIDQYLKEADEEEYDIGSPEWAIETLINGNISDFKNWLKKASVEDVLIAIEYYADGSSGKYKEIINKMRRYL